MSREASIHSEDDSVWTASDVEKSLLHNGMTESRKNDAISFRALLKGCAVYLVMSFCFGALLSLALVSLSQNGVVGGSFPSQGNQWIQTTELREAVSSSYSNVRFDGTFDRSSPYKGPPSPKVDDLWHEVTGLGVMSISEEVYEHLNASKHAVKVPENLGGGRMAIFEMIHQVHCVQALWQAAYPEYYTEQRDFKMSHPKDWYGHLDHCADMLRQTLMCNADTSLVTYNWLKGHSRPHPNFNVQHQCRDYRTVLKFAQDHQIDKDNSEKIGVEMLKPKDGLIMEFEGEPPFDPNAIPLQKQP